MLDINILEFWTEFYNDTTFAQYWKQIVPIPPPCIGTHSTRVKRCTSMSSTSHARLHAYIIGRWASTYSSSSSLFKQRVSVIPYTTIDNIMLVYKRYSATPVFCRETGRNFTAQPPPTHNTWPLWKCKHRSWGTF